ncbi:NLP/P60 protein [Rutstroemia sp. NJR-2017a WRK4]|nr:NLP/P60 protein [Rutstroemia sp. NJR-2017a WRK4]
MKFFSSYAVVLFLVARGQAAFKPPINNTLEHAVETECKTCPYSLCTNKKFYEYDTQVTLVCWTSGTVIDGDSNASTWLRTTDDCYVTQYDLTDYADETDLSFCGPESTEEHITYDSARTKYNTECNICDNNSNCEVIKYIKYGTDITVTCWTDEGALVIDDSTWLKTTDNCYVAQIGLEDPADKSVLDNCGPVGFVQVNYTYPEKVKQRSPSPVPVPKAEKELEKRYLLNITVGEDYAACHSCANTTCEVERRYPFNHEVIVQCYLDAGLPSPNSTYEEAYWYLTTDFCYVRELDFWESLFDREYFLKDVTQNQVPFANEDRISIPGML